MKKVLFILLLLCSIHFWGYVYLPKQVYYATDAVSLLIMGLSFLKMFKKDGLNFRNAIIIYFIGLIINILAAYFHYGQHFRDSFLLFGPFYFILFYFSLHEMQISRKYVENVIIVFAILYSFIYLIQLYYYPKPLFTYDMHADRGTIRLRIQGNGFLVLAFFLLLNRYLINQKFTNIFLLGFFFAILLKGGFRTLTFATLLITVLMVVKLIPYAIKNYITIILAIGVFAGLIYSRGSSAIIKNMISTTQKQRNEGQKYIRARCLNYYLTIYPAKKSYYIFGGGFSTGSNNLEARSDQYIEDKFGYYWVDLGLIGFYIVVGAIACFGILWYTLKAIFTKVPPEMVYLNFYFLYLLFVSFTTMEIYRNGVFAVEAIVLYLIDVNRIVNKLETS
jgi:hypothetical protein